MDYQEKLWEKYFKGETTLVEEKELRKLAAKSNSEAEKDMLRFFESERRVPDDLEESLLAGLEKRQKAGGHVHRLRWYSISSAAAVILIILSIFIDIRHERNVKMENEFFVMEHALYQVSQSLQPEEQEEVMILWVDDDVEFIIN